MLRNICPLICLFCLFSRVLWHGTDQEVLHHDSCCVSKQQGSSRYREPFGELFHMPLSIVSLERAGCVVYRKPGSLG